ncbi:MAG: nucleotidyltransferase domain-containing protein, partial [Sciscionella sp.]
TALAAFLGGSAGTVLATPTSDLDIVVLLDGDPAPFRQTSRYESVLIDLFVETVDAFNAFLDREAARRRSPLLHMCAHGRVLVDRAGVATSIQQGALARLADGPQPLSDDEREDSRYQITCLVDDLHGTQDPDELLFVGEQLLVAVSEFVLLERQQWLGVGKWLLRRLRVADPESCERLLAGYRLLIRSSDGSVLGAAAETVLERSGGRLTDGYYRDGVAALAV